MGNRDGNKRAGRERYRAFLRPYTKRFLPEMAVLFIFSIAFGAAQIAAAYLSRPLIDHITGGGGGFTYLFVITPLLFVAASGLNFAVNLWANTTLNKAFCEARLDLVKKIAKNPSITDKHESAALINITSNDASTVIAGALLFVPWVVSGGVSLAASLALMFYYSWIAGVVTVVIFPLFLVLSMVFAAKSGKFQALTSESDASLKSVALSGINGAFYLKRMNAANYLLTKQAEQMRTHKRRYLTAMRYQNLGNSVISFLLSLFPLTMFAIILATAAGGYGSLSNSMLIYILASSILTPLQLMQHSVGLKVASRRMYERVSLVNDYVCVKKEGRTMVNLVKIGQIDEIGVSIRYFRYSMQGADGVKENGAAEPLGNANAALNAAADNINTNANAVREEDEKTLLTGFSFLLKRGEFCAIMGESGSGKSTLLKFLSNELELPKECGVIKVNGVNLYDLDEDSYYKAMQYVPQTNYLFKDTLKGNLCLGQNYSGEEITAAVKTVGLEEFVAEYSLDREIEEGSKNISGGQLQRVCLARAVLRKPSLLILDEPTSALDGATSAKLVKNLKDYSRENNCAVLIVTHSQDVADAADKIIRL